MLREIHELTRELKRPVESARGMIHVELNRQIQKMLQALLVNLLAPAVVREEQTQREHVGQLRVVHFHVWSKLAGRSFWIPGRETINDVVRLRSVGNDA